MNEVKFDSPSESQSKKLNMFLSYLEMRLIRYLSFIYLRVSRPDMIPMVARLNSGARKLNFDCIYIIYAHHVLFRFGSGHVYRRWVPGCCVNWTLHSNLDLSSYSLKPINGHN